MKQYFIHIYLFKGVFFKDLFNLVPGTMKSENVSSDEINDGETKITLLKFNSNNSN